MRSARRLILPAVLCVCLMAEPVQASELSGTVYTGGAPAANLTFIIRGGPKDVRVTTGNGGGYKVDLPPGNYVLIIRGKEIPVTVPAKDTRRDVRL